MKTTQVIEYKSPQLRILVIGSLILFTITAGCMITFTVSRLRNADRLTKAQVEVFEAQKENIGKPTIIEQRYFSPQK